MFKTGCYREVAVLEVAICGGLTVATSIAWNNWVLNVAPDCTALQADLSITGCISHLFERLMPYLRFYKVHFNTKPPCTAEKFIIHLDL